MCEVKLQDIDVHVDIIKKKLTTLKEDKAAGDDNLSPRILKAISDEVAYPVAVIALKVGLREEEIKRWTSSKTNGLPSPIGCKTFIEIGTTGNGTRYYSRCSCTR